MQENWSVFGVCFKTALDVTRSLLWAVASQVIYPYCGDIIEARDIDLGAWQKQGFSCEHQGRFFF